jgi:parallel beta-helix repeat protein
MAQILGNHINSLSNEGIVVGNTDACNLCIIANNYLQGTEDSVCGIGVYQDGADNLIEGNIVNGFPEQGIYLFTADRTTIVGNRVTGATDGLYIANGSDRTLVVGNILYGNTNNYTNAGQNTTAGNNITA